MTKEVLLFVYFSTINIVSPCTLNKVEGDTYVYICTGKKAYSYHCNRGCRGLNKCQAEIKKVTLEYAKSIKRIPCKICY